MANITVQFLSSHVSFETNDLAPYMGGLKRVLRLKTSISKVDLFDDRIEYYVSDSKNPYLLSFEANTKGYLVVDSINGLTITSIDDLYDKIKDNLDV